MMRGMRAEEQADAAATLGDARRWLDEIAGLLEGADLDVERALPPLHEISGRLLDVEITMRSDLERRTPRGLRVRIRAWSTPRVTSRRHHRAEPLTVPTRYLRSSPPQPAPRITLVTPTYQQGAFLERTIYSVVSQHYPNLEYVVQDGGSTDETAGVLRRWEGAITRIASAPDDGQADALNRGFAGTTGEIMAFLNSDDLLLPGSLAHVARQFAEHPEVDVIYGNRLIIDEFDGRIGAHVLPAHDDATLGLFDFVPQETLFWRRSAWEAAGGHIDTSFGFALDWDLLLRLRESGARMLHLPRFLGAFRVHGEQKSQTALAAFQRDAERLLQRASGRGMTLDEAYARARPYLRRHILHHTLARAVERLPLPRSRVRTLPPTL